MFSFGYDLFLHFGIPCDTIFSIIIFVWIFVYHVWVGNSCLISFQQQKHVAQVWESYAQRFYEDFMKEELVCYPTTKWDSSKAPILDPLQSRLLWSDQIWYENESDWFEGTLGPYIYVFSWNHQFWKMSSVMYYPDVLMPDRFSFSLTFPKSNYLDWLYQIVSNIREIVIDMSCANHSIRHQYYHRNQFNTDEWNKRHWNIEQT